MGDPKLDENGNQIYDDNGMPVWLPTPLNRRNVDNIDTTGVDCYAIIDDHTIMTHNNSNGERAYYKLVSNKYYRTNTEFNQPQLTSETNCYDVTAIKNLPSRYDFAQPFLETLAIASAIMIFYIAYKLILYPFFRKKI